MSHRTFSEWTQTWIELASFRGRRLPDAEVPTSAVVALWHEPVPPGWMRGLDTRLVDRSRRYCRSNDREGAVRRGEHALEFEFLSPAPAEVETTVLGARLIDGVNAVPLAKDIGGGRRGNVEADMLLLVDDGVTFQHQLVEVKTRSGNAWYAAVENLRQLRLYSENVEVRRSLFPARCPELPLRDEVPVMAVVIAPAEFYSARRAKADSVPATQALLRRMQREAGVVAALATWDPRTRRVERVEAR